MAIKVGSFQADANTGAHSQVEPHSLGELPKAMLLFSTGVVGSGFRTSAFRVLGFVDQDRNAFSQTSCDADNIASGGDYGYRVNDSAWAIITQSALVGEFDISAWDADSFTVNWTTKTSTAQWTIGYILIGGDTYSKVLEWIVSGTGSKSVTGAGFQPQLALTFAFPWGPSGSFPTEVFTTAVAHHQLGAATSAADEWAYALRSLDNGVSSDTCREFWNTASILGHRDASDTGNHTIDLQANLTSFDPDGGTWNFTVEAYSNARVFILFLGNLDQVQAGSFTKSVAAAPVSQDITPGWQPEAVLLISQHEDTINVDHADGFGAMGAFDGTDEVTVGWWSDWAASTSNTGSYASTTKALQKVENLVETIDAECDGSILATGFRLTWTTNDTSGDDDDVIGYIALKTLPVPDIPIVPDPVQIPLSVLAPLIGYDQTFSPDPVVLPISVPAPWVTSIIGPDATAVPLAIAAPTISHALALSPTPVAVPLETVEPFILVDRIIAPAPLAVPLAVTQPVAGVTLTLAPSPAAVSLALAAPASITTNGRTVSPTPATIPVASVMPSVSFSQTISPSPATVLVRVVPLLRGAANGGGISIFTEHRPGLSYVYLYDPDGFLVSSTLTPLHYRISRYRDRIGNWKVEIPVDEIAGLLPVARQVGANWKISIRQEGFNPNHAATDAFLLYKGIVETRHFKLTAGGQSVLSLTGAFRELSMSRRTIGLGYEYDTTLSGFTDALIDDLLDGDDAIMSDTAAAIPLSGSFSEPLSRYAAWLKGLAAARYSVRESWDNDRPELVPYAGPPNPGIVIRKLYEGEDRYLHENGETGVGLIAGEPTINYDGSQLYNRIIAYGTDTVADPADSTKTVTGSLTLNDATLSSPYVVQSALNPDGTTYYYIEDAESIALYGLIEHVMIRPDIKNPNNLAASREQAANVLYWTTVNELIKHRSEKVSIQIGPLANGAHIWNLPGDQSWVQYEGSVKLEDGDDSIWIDLEKRFILAERHDESHPSGVRRVEFVLTAAEMEFEVGDLPEVINPFDPEGPTLPDLNLPPMPPMPEIPGLDIPPLEMPEIPGVTEPPGGGGGGVVTGQLRIRLEDDVLEYWDGADWQLLEPILETSDPGGGGLWLEPP